MKAKETNKDTLQIRIDKELKSRTQKTLKSMGLDFTTAITIFFNKVNNEQAIPFTVTADGFYSDSNEKMLMKSIKQAKEGKVIVKTLEELEELENE
ncbi:MAG: type II toxin-antitoxin system RelB/DinJ family antitoxin [Leptotrichiaceae bacterium]|nr:type II toxin-antitoxin system RelB/DinJ family antitoxin [Leptotrichiaceae bacterium]